MSSRKKIKEGINRNEMENVAKDLLVDAFYSFATDLLREMHEDGNIRDLDKAILAVNTVTRGIASNGINLRRANIERRTNARKKKVEEVEIDKEEIKWRKYPKNKSLEYTTDFKVGNKYILKKRKEDVVVGLLKEEQLEDDYEDKGKYKLGSRDKEKLFAMGFTCDTSYIRK